MLLGCLTLGLPDSGERPDGRGNLLSALSPHLSPRDRSFRTHIPRSQRCSRSSEQWGLLVPTVTLSPEGNLKTNRNFPVPKGPGRKGSSRDEGPRTFPLPPTPTLAPFSPQLERYRRNGGRGSAGLFCDVSTSLPKSVAHTDQDPVPLWASVSPDGKC